MQRNAIGNHYIVDDLLREFPDLVLTIEQQDELTQMIEGLAPADQLLHQKGEESWDGGFAHGVTQMTTEFSSLVERMHKAGDFSQQPAIKDKLLAAIKELSEN